MGGIIELQNIGCLFTRPSFWFDLWFEFVSTWILGSLTKYSRYHLGDAKFFSLEKENSSLENPMKSWLHCYYCYSLGYLAGYFQARYLLQSNLYNFSGEPEKNENSNFSITKALFLIWSWRAFFWLFSSLKQSNSAPNSNL